VQLALGKVGSGEQERQPAFMILPLVLNLLTAGSKTHLGSNQQVPPLHEMPAEISSRLSDNLHSDVVPWHTRDLSSVERIIEGFVEVVELGDTLVPVVFTAPDGSSGTGKFGMILVGQDMLRRIPSTIASEISSIPVVAGHAYRSRPPMKAIVSSITHIFSCSRSAVHLTQK